ncbi:MAG: Glu-tRNA(Gln) amidotransferase subunit GatE [Promethearchaeota archaeon]
MERKPKTEFDYNAVGLKIGIEIHQQLASKTKLFCHCPNQLQGTRPPDFTIVRKQRPVLGESGSFDKGMLVEFLKKGTVVYEGYNDCTCTYELDETPPFEVDKECIDITLQIAQLLHMDIIRELHVCRKNYVDGSVPGGFQRTMEAGQNGYINLANGKKIGIENIFLEEDAARRSKTEGKTVFFRVDRLGIPLNEITTTPNIHHPDEAREAAYRIGLLLRSTNRVKSVLGSTRQDINISIKDGERIEVKGVQKLDWIPELVKFEIQRQQALIKIKNDLAKHSVKVDDIQRLPVEVSEIFKETPCKFIAAGIKRGQKLTALRIPGFDGIYGTEVYPDRRFGTEVADKVKTLTGLKGLIHSDEDLIGKYQFAEKEIDQVREHLGIKKGDLFILLLAKGQALETALDIIVDRTKMAFNGVPPETRQAQEDGSHVFLRELGGERRLYPDTDTKPILISDDLIKKAKDACGPYPWDVMKEFSAKYNTSEDQIERLIMTGKLELFERCISVIPDNLPLVLRIIVDVVKVLHRANKPVENLQDKHFLTLLKAIKDGKIAKEACEAVMEIWTDAPNLGLEEAKKKAGISDFDLSKLDKILQEIVEKNKELISQRGRGAMGPLMGDVMKKVGRGAVDGKLLSSKLQNAMKPYIQNKPAPKNKTKGGKK